MIKCISLIVQGPDLPAIRGIARKKWDEDDERRRTGQSLSKALTTVEEVLRVVDELTISIGPLIRRGKRRREY